MLLISIYRHGKGNYFSCGGILLAVQYFIDRGHKEITVFVPSWRKEASKPESPIADQDILLHLEKEGQLVFTPSKRIGERRIVCYDDRFIVKLAATNAGVIVSNDNYRDLVNENDSWRETIENRVLMFTFAQDLFMVPDDPYGRNGPSLEQLLRFDTGPPPPKGQTAQKQAGKICPYADKCTFGKKCRFYHPDREEANSSSRASSGSSTPVLDQKATHTLGHSRASSTEDLSPAVAVQPGKLLAVPHHHHPSRSFDISEVEEKLSTLSIVPELLMSDSEQGTLQHFMSSVGYDRKFVHSMPSQVFEMPTNTQHRSASTVQVTLNNAPMAMAAKRCTYPLAQPSMNQSKPAKPSPAPVGTMGNCPEHACGSLAPPLRMHRDMNGQLLSRGIAMTEALPHLPLAPHPPPHCSHSLGYHPPSPSPQYTTHNLQPQSPVHFGDPCVYNLKPSQQSASYISNHSHHYNSSYHTNHADSYADQSRYPVYVERDYQSVHHSNLYTSLLTRLGPEYGNKIMLFLQLYPDVKNVDVIVDFILHKL